MYGKFMIAAVAGLLLAVVPAMAEQSIKIEIPFDFEAGAMSLPAGNYDVSFPGQHTLLIQNADRKAATFVMTISAHAASDPGYSRLVFNRYGDRYFLSQVWSSGYEQGRQLAKSKAEVELARGRPQRPQVATVLPAKR